MIGKQVSSTKESAPGWSQGSSGRFQYDFVKVAKEIPGAGQYKVDGAVGKQTLSIKKTLPTARIGTSTRDKADKVFISAEHEKAQYGKITPGPCTGTGHTSMGKQTLSKKKSNPTWGFGTAARKTIQVTDTPGPGTYWA
jgi:hypothetical protein